MKYSYSLIHKCVIKHVRVDYWTCSSRFYNKFDKKIVLIEILW